MLIVWSKILKISIILQIVLDFIKIVIVYYETMLKLKKKLY